MIEVLSPGNKRSASDGRAAYLARQRDVLGSDANLVEIDLLRGGEHTAAVPREALSRLGPYAYLVVVRRAARPIERELYAVGVHARLPRIGVPLRSEDPDVVADLQVLVERAWECGAYWKTVDYGAPPDPPLPPDEAAWARGLLRRAATSRSRSSP